MQLPYYPVQGEALRAVWCRQVVDYLRSITLRSSPWVMARTSACGTTLKVVGREIADRDPIAALLKIAPFGYEISADRRVTVRAGSVRWAGVGTFKVASSECAIESQSPDAPDWVHVEMKLRPEIQAPSVKVIGTEPESDSDNLRIPLFSFFLGTGNGPVIRKDLCRLFDIVLVSPVG